MENILVTFHSLKVVLPVGKETVPPKPAITDSRQVTYSPRREKLLQKPQISEKDVTDLKPWFSGSGPFPGRTDMTTSKPETLLDRRRSQIECLRENPLQVTWRFRHSCEPLSCYCRKRKKRFVAVWNDTTTSEMAHLCSQKLDVTLSFRRIIGSVQMPPDIITSKWEENISDK
ncbi:LOW QUALITY PROTEIN: hypothetical protein V2J09_007703 [Rumex salicifolius]